MTATNHRPETFGLAHTRVSAACRAVGKASVWLGPGPFPADCDRLMHLRDIIRELAEELGLQEFPGLGNQDPDTNPTDGSNL